MKIMENSRSIYALLWCVSNSSFHQQQPATPFILMRALLCSAQRVVLIRILYKLCLERMIRCVCVYICKAACVIVLFSFVLFSSTLADERGFSFNVHVFFFFLYSPIVYVCGYVLKMNSIPLLCCTELCVGLFAEITIIF